MAFHWSATIHGPATIHLAPPTVCAQGTTPLSPVYPPVISFFLPSCLSLYMPFRRVQLALPTAALRLPSRYHLAALCLSAFVANVVCTIPLQNRSRARALKCLTACVLLAFPFCCCLYRALPTCVGTDGAGWYLFGSAPHVTSFRSIFRYLGVCT